MERLRRTDPQVISRNAQVRYDAATGTYWIPILNGGFACLPEEERIFSREARTDIRENFQLSW